MVYRVICKANICLYFNSTQWSGTQNDFSILFVAKLGNTLSNCSDILTYSNTIKKDFGRNVAVQQRFWSERCCSKKILVPALLFNEDFGMSVVG